MPRPAAGLGAILIGTIAFVASAAAEETGATARPTPAETVAGHCEAWNTTDRAARDRLLERVFAADGVYSDPTPIEVTGRAGLSDQIATFQREYAGARFRCSAPQIHHRDMRVSWLLLRADGSVEAEGMDFYELSPDGLIRRVTGFFGPAPAIAPER
jgi:hypothetical protein